MHGLCAESVGLHEIKSRGSSQARPTDCSRRCTDYVRGDLSKDTLSGISAVQQNGSDIRTIGLCAESTADHMDKVKCLSVVILFSSYFRLFEFVVNNDPAEISESCKKAGLSFNFKNEATNDFQPRRKQHALAPSCIKRKYPAGQTTHRRRR